MTTAPLARTTTQTASAPAEASALEDAAEPERRGLSQRLGKTFRALKHRDFRLFWSGPGRLEHGHLGAVHRAGLGSFCA